MGVEHGGEVGWWDAEWHWGVEWHCMWGFADLGGSINRGMIGWSCQMAERLH